MKETSYKAIYRLFTGLASLAVFLIALILVRREMGARQATSSQTKPSPVVGWQSYAAAGNAMGPATSPTTVIVFADYQCPFCRRFSLVLDSLRLRNPRVKVVERHLPLTSLHSEAYQAALAAECGAALGKYEQIRAALFRKRSAVEDSDWGSVARAAEVRDTTNFVSCVTSARFDEHVKRDRIAAESLGLSGTPSVIVNGMLYRRALSLTELEAAIERRSTDTR